ncbi:uncharacterized protein LOC134296056 isoform X2 [Anolis carolinensis]|uniref:uncharacterized protein LOC134296056 isoform X2 n=1 Tax=Anolis carolinensis TaxID=28377 RepID=UPI002F2B8C14
MKLFSILSLLLSSGLFADAESKGRKGGLTMKHISEEACKEWVEQCIETECVRNMIFHGLCHLNPECCDKDPVELCKKKGGQCAVAECGKDAISLGKCFGKSSCCKSIEKTTTAAPVTKKPQTPAPDKKAGPARGTNNGGGNKTGPNRGGAVATTNRDCPDLEVSQYP